MRHMLMIVQLYQGPHYKDPKLITNRVYFSLTHYYMFCILINSAYFTSEFSWITCHESYANYSTTTTKNWSQILHDFQSLRVQGHDHGCSELGTASMDFTPTSTSMYKEDTFTYMHRIRQIGLNPHESQATHQAGRNSTFGYLTHLRQWTKQGEKISRDTANWVPWWTLIYVDSEFSRITASCSNINKPLESLPGMSWTKPATCISFVISWCSKVDRHFLIQTPALCYSNTYFWM